MLIVSQADLLTRSLQLLKIPVALFLGIVTTVFLLYLMQSLIESGEDAITDYDSGRMVDFVRLKEDPVVQTKNRKPKPPPSPDEPPPPIQQQQMLTQIDNAWTTKFTPPPVNVDMSNSANFYSDGEYLPIIKVQPNYPTRALQRGMFGWVIVEFTVDDLGRVIDPTVIENCVDIYTPNKTHCEDRPGRIFDKPALAAASKFKYKPKVVDGKAIETIGVRHLITFELDEMQQHL